MAPSLTFGNRSLAAHLARGALGIGALVASLRGYEVVGWPALLFLIVSLWALKGCPVCWTIGLFETIAAKVLRTADPEGL